jgi:hypothetical protein
MIRKLLMACAFGAALVGAAGYEAAAHGEATVDAGAAFALLKTLEGSWTASDATGRQSKTSFRLSAGGTVLVEEYENPALPRGGHMLTAYHLDGSDLVLTHYCIAGNQPTLRAARFDAGAKDVQFEFLRAGNMAGPDAGHMRRARYRIIDRDTFVTEWEYFEKGAKRFTEIDTFTRVK